MADDSSISDEPGTILDSYDRVLKGMPLPLPAARSPAVVEEVLSKPPYRWTAPRILICDDDSLEKGETVRLRSDRIVIGRTKGEIVIGHDVATSGSHAEIVRSSLVAAEVWNGVR
jgi:hypothetical protein